jgi:hypothetical protein
MVVVVTPAAVMMMMMAVDANADADGAHVSADDVRTRSAGAQQGEREDRSEKRFHERSPLFDDGSLVTRALNGRVSQVAGRVPNAHRAVTFRRQDGSGGDGAL